MTLQKPPLKLRQLAYWFTPEILDLSRAYRVFRSGQRKNLVSPSSHNGWVNEGFIFLAFFNNPNGR
jgi:hypothetical protein